MDPALLTRMLLALTNTSRVAVELFLKLQRQEECDIDLATRSYDTRLLVAFMEVLTTVTGQAVFIMEDTSLLMVSRESREGLLQDCGFCPDPYAAHLCAAMVPPPRRDSSVERKSYP
ncbi:hypothetical protein UY3_05721 [Chelonia mydas]|uniref:Uncharacterized protein n=1 Tax=Chelonia mydas TaxID=8469 RepID=M7BN85_CHEMY|nr:hypothetical protein UY3_05721 [Chelonia mydas]